MINEYNEKIKDERKGGIITAFYSAYFSRIEKLSGSDLEKVLDGMDETEQEMSDEKMLSVVKKLI